MSSLNDTLISDTFDSLIHANGNVLPVSGLIDLYDGSGNKSSLSIGRDTSGIKVAGKVTADTLTVGSVNYPTLNGTIGHIVYQQTATQWGYLGQIPSSLLETLSPSPAKTYSNPITSITVNSKGQVTDVVEIDDFKASKNIIAHHAPHVSVTSTAIIIPASLSAVSSWVRIDLTNDGLGSTNPDLPTASVINSTKAITGFLRSSGVVDHGGKQTFIQATPSPNLLNGTNPYMYPVLYDIPTNSSDQRGLGGMFYCPVSKETSGGVERNVIYLRNRGDGSSTLNATSWVLTIIAQHV
jgi:hypothetical protein